VRQEETLTARPQNVRRDVRLDDRLGGLLHRLRSENRRDGGRELGNNRGRAHSNDGGRSRSPLLAASRLLLLRVRRVRRRRSRAGHAQSLGSTLER
jgi:hypothetical protein